MSKADGRRDLSLVRSSGSTARVLNLALVFERFGQTEAFNQQPLFKHSRLNRSLILKHVLRPHERANFPSAAATATKLILPFAPTELSLGGVSLLVGERRFESMLREAVGAAGDPLDLASDIELLRLLGTLPSFDPFLMRERLRHVGHEPARCYFDIAEADVARMRAFVSQEISQLIKLAFANAGPDAGEFSTKLAEKLMTDETAKALDPLRETLRLSGDDYVEGVFAWKGFLYYKWITGDLKAQIAVFGKDLNNCRLVRAEPETRRKLLDMRTRVMEQMDAAAARVDASLFKYGEAFAALSAGKPSAFRDFLLEAPSLFIPIGEAVGVIKHIQSFWKFRFPDGDPPVLDGEEALDVFHEFDASLASVAFLRERARAPAA